MEYYSFLRMIYQYRGSYSDWLSQFNQRQLFTGKVNKTVAFFQKVNHISTDRHPILAFDNKQIGQVCRLLSLAEPWRVALPLPDVDLPVQNPRNYLYRNCNKNQRCRKIQQRKRI